MELYNRAILAQTHCFTQFVGPFMILALLRHKHCHAVTNPVDFGLRPVAFKPFEPLRTPLTGALIFSHSA